VAVLEVAAAGRLEAVLASPDPEADLNRLAGEVEAAEAVGAGPRWQPERSPQLLALPVRLETKRSKPPAT